MEILPRVPNPFSCVNIELLVDLSHNQQKGLSILNAIIMIEIKLNSDVYYHYDIDEHIDSDADSRNYEP